MCHQPEREHREHSHGAFCSAVARGGYYFLTADGGALYEELQGKAPTKKENEQVLGLYVNEDGQAFKAQGYVIVAQDAASGIYTIVDIVLQET